MAVVAPESMIATVAARIAKYLLLIGFLSTPIVITPLAGRRPITFPRPGAAEIL